MICVWDDAIPTMFLEFVNLLTPTTSEGELRKSVMEFAEKHELDKFFVIGNFVSSKIGKVKST